MTVQPGAGSEPLPIRSPSGRPVLESMSAQVDVGALAFGRAPAQLAEVLQRIMRRLEEQGASAEEHDVDVRIRHLPPTPLLEVTVEVLAGECGHWRDVPGYRGRPVRVWCELGLFHDGRHEAHRGGELVAWPTT